MALVARTIDQVSPGEQQPESDHNYQGEKSESGVYRDRHWRHASGWFSYDLKDAGKEARKLRVTYYGGDKGRNFAIYVNGTLLKTESLDGSRGEQFFEVDYELPGTLTAGAREGILTVKFAARQGSIAGGVYHVRLLK